VLQNRRPRQQPSHDHAWVPIGPWIQPAGLILSAVVGEDPNPQPLPTSGTKKKQKKSDTTGAQKPQAT